MLEYTEKIREVAKRLLKEGKVEVFIGYKQGTVPMMNEPVLVSNPDKADILYWDSNCGLNLCNYLTNRRDRIGIVANGCNSRNIVTHIIENQISRDQLYIVGLPCTGMIDHRAVARAVKYQEILETTEDGDRFTVKGKDFEETFEKGKLLQTNCAVCLHRNPVIYDEMIAEPAEEQEEEESYSDIEEIEQKSPEEKWGFFTQLISACIRCYSQPQWVGKSIDPIDTMTFHFLRAYHCAGRCTDCGACERVCPVGINMRQFTRKLNKDARDLFSWEAGLSLDQRPLLDVFRPDDYDEFIR
ncbi:MAG: 4Fe-4S ferredoxin [Deltaproteobacteria bacterium]|nr:4Fe-4S ferredoxin [Deltaproteobacteria bacterium]